MSVVNRNCKRDHEKESFHLLGQQHLQYCFILVNEDREPRKQTRAVEWNQVQSHH